jgi:transposase-like protein
MAKKKKTQTTTYNQEFRETAIKLALAGNKPISEVANELGLKAKMLYDWVRAWKKKNNQDESSKLREERLKQLERRNKQLELENEILKKAAAYFAKTLL